MFHRYLSGKVERLVVVMEEEALRMVEVIQGERESE
jgi:biopolymer transport protein ExbB